MAFLTELEPARGVAVDVLPGIRRVVARNSSVMTYYGTNTYLLDGEGGLTVVDPGPDDDEHVRDVLRAAVDKPITRLVVTHAHPDHYGAVKAMRKATGAPSFGYVASGMKFDFTADHGLNDAEIVAGLQAVFTPGHAPDHLSFGYQAPGIGQVLFSGDHVMAWSSTVISPPQGDMRAYYDSLELLLRREDRVYLPGHGPISRNPKALVEELLQHRRMRETAILDALEGGPRNVAEIADVLYGKTDERLKMAARGNVLAHLLKLQDEGRAIQLSGPSDEVLRPGRKIDSWEALSAAYEEIARLDAQRQFKRV
jgi:glyoxylase-like metal-dependent hydrolase (beta-lactamase superfamily II)